MAGFFYNLGRKVGPKVRKGKWIWHSLTGTEAESIQAEYEVGLDLANEIRLQFGGAGSRNATLEKIGAKLTAKVGNKERKFNFEVVDGKEPNAFALPGGFVFVTESILQLCDGDEDEIAFILAHEMGHIIRGHAMERIISSTLTNVVSRTSIARGVVSAWIKNVGLKFFESAYSQSREFDADGLGGRLIRAAGYDPDGATRLLRRLWKLSSDDKQPALSVYFSTHPPFNERISNIGSVLGK
jgi:predicted Zn-dependent protease